MVFAMTRKAIVYSMTLAIVFAAVYFYTSSPKANPYVIPAVPVEWTDPAMIRIVTEKRIALELDIHNGVAWGELGMSFEAHERTSEAIICYEIASKVAPDDSRWTYLLAKQLTWRNQTEDAELVLDLYRQTLKRKSPTFAHARTAELTLADQLLDRSSTKEAYDIYARVFSVDPRNPQAAYFHAQLAIERGDYTTAIPILLAQARNPHTQKKSSAALALISRMKGNVKEADGFEYASSLLPDDSQPPNPFVDEVLQYRRGRQVLMDEVTRLEAQQDYKRASIAAQKLVASYPTPEYLLLSGRAFVNAKEYDSAIATLEDAIVADPKSVMSHASIGMAWFGKAERLDSLNRERESDELYRKAIRSFSKAIELKPDYSPGYLYRAKSFLRLGNTADALTAVRTCISLRPEEWEAYMTLSRVLVAEGKKSEAIQALEQAVKLAHPQEKRPQTALQLLRDK